MGAAPLGDEAASVLSAERSLPSLFRMLGHVDAVHGTGCGTDCGVEYGSDGYGLAELSAAGLIETASDPAHAARVVELTR